MDKSTMTITRFMQTGWDWNQPDLFDQFRDQPEEKEIEPELSDLDVRNDLTWVDNFNTAEVQS
jgi:hypothetical protein